MNYKDKSIAIVTHEYLKGSGQELRDFLNNEGTKEVFYVAHKFFFSKETHSYFEFFKNGFLADKEKTKDFNLNEYTLYLKDFFYTLKFLFTHKGKFDLYVGCGAFNIMPGIILKLFGKVDKLVFFTIDYVMKGRFGNPLIDNLYVGLDRLAFSQSDYTWNVSERISKQRILELEDKAKDKKQITVPIGVPVEEAQKVNAIKRDNTLVYCGSLMPEFGLEIILDSMVDLIKTFPQLELRIIGKGILEKDLKNKAKELNIEKNVDFVGFIDSTKSRELLFKMQKESTIGLAVYEDKLDSYKRFSDVTKPKEYMACGLPVIVTSFISISEDVQKYNLGRVVEYNKESFVSAVSEILENKMEQAEMQKNIREYVKNITWHNIYINTFNEM